MALPGTDPTPRRPSGAGAFRVSEGKVELAGGAGAAQHDRHRPAPGRYGAHDVRFAPGSLASSVMGTAGRVNTYHHQGVADPGRLTASGWADDGVIEAVEDPERRFVLGVQWHPEADDDVRPFRALVEAVTGSAGPAGAGGRTGG